jgi:hypothetical protein
VEKQLENSTLEKKRFEMKKIAYDQLSKKEVDFETFERNRTKRGG